MRGDLPYSSPFTYGMPIEAGGIYDQADLVYEGGATSPYGGEDITVDVSDLLEKGAVSLIEMPPHLVGTMEEGEVHETSTTEGQRVLVTRAGNTPLAVSPAAAAQVAATIQARAQAQQMMSNRRLPSGPIKRHLPLVMVVNGTIMNMNFQRGERIHHESGIYTFRSFLHDLGITEDDQGYSTTPTVASGTATHYLQAGARSWAAGADIAAPQLGANPSSSWAVELVYRDVVATVLKDIVRTKVSVRPHDLTKVTRVLLPAARKVGTTYNLATMVGYGDQPTDVARTYLQVSGLGSGGASVASTFASISDMVALTLADYMGILDEADPGARRGGR